MNRLAFTFFLFLLTALILASCDKKEAQYFNKEEETPPLPQMVIETNISKQLSPTEVVTKWLKAIRSKDIDTANSCCNLNDKKCVMHLGNNILIQGIDSPYEKDKPFIDWISNVKVVHEQIDGNEAIVKTAWKEQSERLLLLKVDGEWKIQQSIK